MCDFIQKMSFRKCFSSYTFYSRMILDFVTVAISQPSFSQIHSKFCKELYPKWFNTIYFKSFCVFWACICLIFIFEMLNFILCVVSFVLLGEGYSHIDFVYQRRLAQTYTSFKRLKPSPSNFSILKSTIVTFYTGVLCLAFEWFRALLYIVCQFYKGG